MTIHSLGFFLPPLSLFPTLFPQHRWTLACTFFAVYGHTRHTLTLGPPEGCFLCLECSFSSPAYLSPSLALSLYSDLTFLLKASLTRPFKITATLPSLSNCTLLYFFFFPQHICLVHVFLLLLITVCGLCLWTYLKH